jgi:hypothetical protein
VLAPVNGQPYPPVPIVVISVTSTTRGRTTAARRLANSVWTDSSFDSPPPTPLDMAACALDQNDPPRLSAYVGWMSGGDPDLTSQRDFADETLYVAITRDAVPLGDWFDPPDGGRTYRSMGQLVCFAHEWDESGSADFDSIAGTAYREYRDGST